MGSFEELGLQVSMSRRQIVELLRTKMKEADARTVSDRYEEMAEGRRTIGSINRMMDMVDSIPEDEQSAGLILQTLSAAQEKGVEPFRAYAACVLRAAADNQSNDVFGVTDTLLEMGEGGIADAWSVLAAERGNPVFYESCGMIMLSRGDAAGAAAWFGRARQAGLIHSTSLQSYADVLEQLGDAAGARALRDELDPPERRRARAEAMQREVAQAVQHEKSRSAEELAAAARNYEAEQRLTNPAAFAEAARPIGEEPQNSYAEKPVSPEEF